MTLAVAACFPWGNLKEIRDSLSPAIKMEQGVILATDSRFTLGDKYRDTGQKVYTIAKDAALVYAGDVLAAQRGIRYIREFLGQHPVRQRDPIEVASFFMKKAYDREQKAAKAGKRTAVMPLYVLVGTSNARGEAWITRFSYGSGFSPIYLLGVEALGYPQDIDNFKRNLLQNEEKRWRDQNIPMDPKHWLIDVAMSMNIALTSKNRSRTIGGKVQAVAITKDGIVEQEVSFVTQGTDPMVSTNWTPVTISLQKVKPFYKSSQASIPSIEPGLISAHVFD